MYAARWSITAQRNSLVVVVKTEKYAIIINLGIKLQLYSVPVSNTNKLSSSLASLFSNLESPFQKVLGPFFNSGSRERVRSTFSPDLDHESGRTVHVRGRCRVWRTIRRVRSRSCRESGSRGTLESKLWVCVLERERALAVTMLQWSGRCRGRCLARRAFAWLLGSCDTGLQGSERNKKSCHCYQTRVINPQERRTFMQVTILQRYRGWFLYHHQSQCKNGIQCPAFMSNNHTEIGKAVAQMMWGPTPVTYPAKILYQKENKTKTKMKIIWQDRNITS